MRFADTLLVALAGTTVSAYAFSDYDEDFGSVYARFAEPEYDEDFGSLYTRSAFPDPEAAAWEHSDSFDEFLVRRELYARTKGSHGPGSVVEGLLGAKNMAEQAVQSKVSGEMNRRPPPNWGGKTGGGSSQPAAPKNDIFKAGRDAMAAGRNSAPKKEGTDWKGVWDAGQASASRSGSRSGSRRGSTSG